MKNKKYNTILLTLFSIVILTLISVPDAHASIIWENGNIDETASDAWPSGNTNSSLSQEWFGSDVGGIPDSFDTVKFWFKGNTADTYNFHLYLNYAGCTSSSGTEIDNTGNFVPTSTNWLTYELTFTETNTTSTKYCYSLWLEDNGGTDANHTYISPLNTGAGKDLESYPGPTTTSSQMYAQFCSDNDCSLPVTEYWYSNWRFPTNNGSVNVNDLAGSRLIYDYVASTTKTTYTRFRIYGDSGLTNVLYDEHGINTIPNGMTTTTLFSMILNWTNVWDNYFPTSTEAWYKVFLYTINSSNQQITEASSTIHVYLNTTTTPDFYETSTSTPTFENLREQFNIELDTCPNGFLANLNASAIWCHAQNAFKNGMSWLFIPKQGSLDFVGNQYDRFKNTFPFVLVFGTADKIIENISSTTSTAIGLSIQLPGDRITGTTTITILGTSSLTSDWGQTAYNAYSNFILTGVATVMIIMLIGLI